MKPTFTGSEIQQVLGLEDIDWSRSDANWINHEKNMCCMTGNTGVREFWISQLLGLKPTGGGAGKCDMVGEFVLETNKKTYHLFDLKNIDPVNSDLKLIDAINTYKSKLDEDWLMLLGSFDPNGKGLIYLVAVDLRECEEELHISAAKAYAQTSGRKHVSVKANVWMKKPSTFVLFKNEALYHKTAARKQTIKHHAQIDKLPSC